MAHTGFNPTYAGIAGYFSGADDGLYWLAKSKPDKHLMVAYQNACWKGVIHKPPYFVGEDQKFYCCDAREFLNLEDHFPKKRIGMAMQYNKTDIATNMAGLLFSGAYTLFSNILILSCAYYEFNVSLVGDEYFDQLCLALQHRLAQGMKLTGHPHERLFEYLQLSGGSGHDIPEWPGMLIGATQLFIKRKCNYAMETSL